MHFTSELHSLVEIWPADRVYIFILSRQLGIKFSNLSSTSRTLLTAHSQGYKIVSENLEPVVSESDT